MEAKLKQYRARQRRQELINTAKEQYEKSKAKLVELIVPKGIFGEMSNSQEEHALLMEEEEPPSRVHPVRKPIQPIEELDLSDVDVASEASQVESLDDKELLQCRFRITRWLVILAVWAFFWGIALYIQFGAVYFVLTILVGIYFNTRTGPKRKGEVSAYSVFNQNCASIEGTINPEQFEREIRYGVGNTRSYNI